MLWSGFAVMAWKRRRILHGYSVPVGEGRAVHPRWIATAFGVDQEPGVGDVPFQRIQILAATLKLSERHARVVNKDLKIAWNCIRIQTFETEQCPPWMGRFYAIVLSKDCIIFSSTLASKNIVRRFCGCVLIIRVRVVSKRSMVIRIFCSDRR